MTVLSELAFLSTAVDGEVLTAEMDDLTGEVRCYRLKDVAALLGGVSADMVERLVASGELPALRLGNGGTRKLTLVRHCDLKAYLARRVDGGG